MKGKKVLLSILGFLFILPLTSCSKTVKHDISEYILDKTIEYKDDFRILQLTDLHISNKDDRERQYKFIGETIDKNTPNMIVVTGDLFTFASKSSAKELFSFFESKQIPWTITFGNHDEQCYFSIDWLTGYLNKLSSTEGSYCYFKDIQDDDISGNANFAINIMKDNQVFEQVVIMDSNRYHYGSYIGYDYIKENQINWYKDLVEYNYNTYSKRLDTLLYFHIPVPEFEDAWNELVDNNMEDTVNASLYNADKYKKLDPVSCPEYNSGFFDAILEGNSADGHGSTKAISCGHDHISDFIIQYKGVYLNYGVNSTDRIYFEDGMLGGTHLIIHNDNSLDFEQILRNYSEYND